MKKILTVFISLLLIGGNMKIQAQDKQPFFNVSLGTGIAIGEFGSDDPTSEEAGFAMPGFQFQLSAGKKEKGDLGFSGVYQFNSNPFNSESFEEALEDQFQGQGFNVNASVEENSYILHSFIGNVNYYTGSGNIGFGLFGGAGISIVKLPKLKGDLSGSVDFNQESATSGTLCYNLGAEVDYKIRDGIALIFGVDYFSTNPEFKDVTFTMSGGGESNSQSTDFNQKVSILNLSAGIVKTF